MNIYLRSKERRVLWVWRDEHCHAITEGAASVHAEYWCDAAEWRASVDYGDNEWLV